MSNEIEKTNKIKSTSALITFIITVCLSLVLVMSGVIVTLVDRSPSNTPSSNNTTYKSIYLDSSLILNTGKNEFKFNVSESGYYTITINGSASYISSVSIDGSTIIESSDSSNYNSYYEKYLSKGTHYITVKISASSTDTHSIKIKSGL